MHVYTNGSAENEERVRKLGVEKFIDYKKENFADVLSDVDYVLDTLGDRALPDEFIGLLKRKTYDNQPKYYFTDLGFRNARLNFRQVEETHAMENTIFNELKVRGYNVDVGVVVMNESFQSSSTLNFSEKSPCPVRHIFV